jgi:hypothetical protein
MLVKPKKEMNLSQNLPQVGRPTNRFSVRLSGSLPTFFLKRPEHSGVGVTLKEIGLKRMGTCGLYWVGGGLSAVRTTHLPFHCQQRIISPLLSESDSPSFPNS